MRIAGYGVCYAISKGQKYRHATVAEPHLGNTNLGDGVKKEEIARIQALARKAFIMYIDQRVKAGGCFRAPIW